jgi:hypothetical protein
MRWLALALLLSLAACVPGSQSVPDALGIQVGDVIANWDGMGRSRVCEPNRGWSVAEISGDLVRVNETDWINLGARSHIRICKRAGG